MLAIGRTFGALYLATVLMQMGSTLLMTYLALRLNTRGVAEFWVGSLMAANAAGMVLAGWVGNALIQRAGHIHTYSACAGVIAASVLAHELTTSLPAWLVLRAVVGLVMMCQAMVLESWLNERAPGSQRGGVLAMYMLATYVGMMLGQLGISVAGEQGVQALLAVAMAFALCQVPLAVTRSAPPQVQPAVRVALGPLIRRAPQALLTVLAAGVLNSCFFGLAAIYTRQHGIANAQIGVFLASVVGAGMLAQLPLGRLSDRVPRVGLIRMIAFLLIFACLPLGYFGRLSLMQLVLFGAGIGCLQFCFYPLGVALANEHIEPELRVPMSGLLLGSFGVGSCIGPLLAGALMQRFGAGSLYYFFAASAAMLALAMSRHSRAEVRNVAARQA